MISLTPEKTQLQPDNSINADEAARELENEAFISTESSAHPSSSPKLSTKENNLNLQGFKESKDSESNWPYIDTVSLARRHSLSLTGRTPPKFSLAKELLELPTLNPINKSIVSSMLDIQKHCQILSLATLPQKYLRQTMMQGKKIPIKVREKRKGANI